MRLANSCTYHCVISCLDSLLCWCDCMESGVLSGSLPFASVASVSSATRKLSLESVDCMVSVVVSCSLDSCYL